MSRLLPAALALGLALTATAAFAGPSVCGPRAHLAETLLSRHAERPISMGLDAKGAVVEVFAGPAGNWTILLTQPSGLSCLLASGQSWESLPVATASAGPSS